MHKQLTLRAVERPEIDYQQVAAAVLRLVREQAKQTEQPEREQPQERRDG